MTCSPRLFHFLYGNNVGEHVEVLHETPIVPIDVNPPDGGGDANDLIGRLSSQLSKDASAKQSAIIEPSEMVAFQLTRSSSTHLNTTGTSSERKPFIYPKTIYLDQFLKENVEFAENRRRQQHEMYAEAQKLMLRKKSMTHFNVSIG